MPVLAPDLGATDEDTLVDVRVLANDRDANRDALRVVAVNPSGTDGVITIPQGGRSITYDPRGAFDWLPEGATAEDRFGYTATDQRGGLDTSTVTVTVTGVNDAPVARDDAATTDEDTPVTIDVLANDSDIDAGDSLTVVEESGIPGPASSTITPDGRMLYDPDGAFDSLGVGEVGTDNFTYVIEDALGARAEARVTVTVFGVNDAPVIEATTFVVDEHQPARVIGTVPANDPDGSDTLTYSIVTGNEAGLFALDSATGELSTTGPLNFEARAEHTLTVAVADPHGGTAQADVTIAVGDVAGDVLFLGDLDGRNGFVINGVGAGDRSGASVSNAGDLNDDGIDDLIVGAPLADPGGRADAGAAYVIFGGTNLSADGNFDLADLDGANGFAVEGTAAQDLLGSSARAAGDINGDGIDDLIVGAPGIVGGGAGFDAGGAYVIFGRQDIGGTGTLDPASLDGSGGFLVSRSDVVSPTQLIPLGTDVGTVGDVNGDGFDDFFVAALGQTSRPPTAQGFVVFGGPGIGAGGAVDLATLDGSDGFSVGRAPISEAGDVNGDGTDDLIIGFLERGPGGALVVFGGPDVGGTGVLGPLDGSNGFGIGGNTLSFGSAGSSVSGGGDLNNDGFDDLLLVGPGGFLTPDGSVFDPGGSYVVFGGTDVGASGDLSLGFLDYPDGFQLVGAFGPISFAGDVNDDGTGDFISANGDDAFVVFGRTGLGADGDLDAVDLDGTNGFIIRGPQDGIGLGASVSDAGDVNGDGIDDLIIGAPQADPDGRTDAGQSFVVFGTPGGAPLQVADLLDQPDVDASSAPAPATADDPSDARPVLEAMGGASLDALLVDAGGSVAALA